MRKGELIQMRMNQEISKEEFVKLREDIENRITVAQVSKNEAQIEELDIEVAISYSVEFLRNLARIWQNMADIDQKKRLQDLVLPRGITYDKNQQSYRTAILSPILRLNQEFKGDESGFVAWVRQNLNQLLVIMKA